MSETEKPREVSPESRFTVPLALLIGIVVTAATGYAAWTGTREQVDRNTKDIDALNMEVRAMRETLFEIRGDVKYLVRGSSATGTGKP